MIIRKKSKLKITLSLLIVAISAGFLTACSVRSENDDDLTEAGEVLYEDKTSQVEFSWWGTDERHKYYIEGISKFMKLNPDIRVETSYGVWDGYERRNRIAMASKTEADVMLINYSWLDEFSGDGDGYYDLNSLSDIIDLSQFSESDLSYGTRNGKLNAIPLAYNTTIFLYNSDIYKKYGLDIPKTWDDLFYAAQVMGKDGVYPIGMVKKQFFLTMVAHYEQSSGKKVFSTGGRLNITVDGVREMLEFYKSLVDNKVMKPIGQFDTNSFLSGESAGIACWINDAVKYGKSLDNNLQSVKCGEFITMDGVNYSGWYKKPATMYAMSKRTKYPKEAARLMEYLLNDEDFAKEQGIEKGFPVSRKANDTVKKYVNIPDFALEANDIVNNESYNLEIMPSEMENVDVINAFREGADKYVYGDGSLDECAFEIIKAMRKT